MEGGESPVCCKDEKKCEKPEELEGKPEDCSREKVKECHGEEKKHKCCE